MIATRFTKFAIGVLVYTVLVIIWGAFVRASWSGDGCGAHWPLCNGAIIPDAEHPKTWVEFGHRISSGLVLPLVIAMLVAAFRATTRGDQARKAAFFSFFFTITEALVGARLVLGGLVAQNDSVSRAVWMAIHLANTFMLLASMALTVWFSMGGKRLRFRNQGSIAWALGIGIAGVLILGVSGAVAALGDTLFPARSLAEGLQQDVSPTAHFLIRLRLLHPMIAVSVGVYLVFVAGLVAFLRPTIYVRRFSNALIALFIVELALGLINVLLKAPIWMQLVHLAVADLLWLSLILLTVAALGKDTPKRALEADEETLAAPTEERQLAAVSKEAAFEDWRQALKAYIALTKPRVISLLLFTTLAAMFIAKSGWPGGWLLFWVALGGYAAAGAANAINMIIDRDIDGRMKRTSKRPTVTQQIPTLHASLFALALVVFSVVSLTWAANLLSALLAMAGLAFYVVVYTLMLKRRTWHNIVIGGAAGCFPPLVGYAAVANNLSPLAWCLFGIIFVWTPVHFWALALLIKDDYAEAGVPMLPVVHGERVTVIQIALYAVVTALVSAIPFVQREVGWVYLAPAAVLNAVLLLQSFQLLKKPERPQAVRLFHYSMVYLALLFLMIAIDRISIL
ncbi:MAG: heme o synthase [Fimbriimonadaceae bacterium]|nr:heme o synthase [Fimbriimonadaceae bacterium]